MPFSGYLVYLGRSICFWWRRRGRSGCNLGSAVAYWIGAKGGRPLVERYGKWVLMSRHDLDRMTFLREIWIDHRVAGAAVAGGADIYRLPGGNCEDAAAALSHLHFCGFLVVVFVPGLCGHEAGRGVAYGPALSGGFPPLSSGYGDRARGGHRMVCVVAFESRQAGECGVMAEDAERLFVARILIRFAERKFGRLDDFELLNQRKVRRSNGN